MDVFKIKTVCYVTQADFRPIVLCLHCLSQSLQVGAAFFFLVLYRCIIILPGEGYRESIVTYLNLPMKLKTPLNFLEIVPTLYFSWLM